MSRISENCRQCDTQACCHKGQTFVAGKDGIESTILRIAKLNPSSPNNIKVDKKKGLFSFTLRRDCEALNDAGRCSVHDNPEKYPEACRTMEADGTFCKGL